MKKRAILSALCIALAFSAAYATHLHAGETLKKALSIVAADGNYSPGMFVDARYIITDNPGACLFPDDLPANCSPVSSATVCKVMVGIYEKKYYQGVSCVTPYYRH